MRAPAGRPTRAAPPRAAAATRAHRAARTRHVRRLRDTPLRRRCSAGAGCAPASARALDAKGASGNRRTSRASSQCPCTRGVPVVAAVERRRQLARRARVRRRLHDVRDLVRILLMQAGRARAVAKRAAAAASKGAGDGGALGVAASALIGPSNSAARKTRLMLIMGSPVVQDASWNRSNRCNASSIARLRSRREPPVPIQVQCCSRSLRRSRSVFRSSAATMRSPTSTGQAK